MSLLDHIPATFKNGSEQLTYKNESLNFSLLNFWQWSISDILSNETRGHLAEFIVAVATKIDVNSVRNEWGAYDLITHDKIKLEIKSAAYLQSWQQSVFSFISFSTKLARHWDNLTNKLGEIPQRHADVYVFCLLKHEEKKTVNPLNLDQWEFYVLATAQLNAYNRSQHSITLNSLKNLTKAVAYPELDDEVKIKNQLNKTIQSSK